VQLLAIGTVRRFTITNDQNYVHRTEKVERNLGGGASLNKRHSLDECLMNTFIRLNGRQNRQIHNITIYRVKKRQRQTNRNKSYSLNTNQSTKSFTLNTYMAIVFMNFIFQSRKTISSST